MPHLGNSTEEIRPPQAGWWGTPSEAGGSWEGFKEGPEQDLKGIHSAVSGRDSEATWWLRGPSTVHLQGSLFSL